MLKIFFISILSLVTFLFLLFALLKAGLRQKFGRFDMPKNELNKLIYTFLADHKILEKDMVELRKKLLDLGFSSLSNKEVTLVLKNYYMELISIGINR